MTDDSAPAPTTTNGPADGARTSRPAGLMTRGAAAGYDAALMLITVLPVVIVGGAIASPFRGPQVVSVVSCLVLLVPLLYTAGDVFWAATPGKIVLDLRVTARDGRPAPRGRRAGRWAVRNAWLLLLAIAVYLDGARDVVRTVAGRPFADVVGTPMAAAVRQVIGLAFLAAPYAAGAWVAGCLFALVPPRRQALHDLLTGTAVYRTADLISVAAGHAFQPILGPGVRQPPPAGPHRVEVPTPADAPGGPPSDDRTPGS